MKKGTKDALILTLITLVSGFCLGTAHEVTKQPIAAAQEKATQEAYREVLPKAKKFDEVKGFDTNKATALIHKKGFDKDTINAVVEAKDSSGKNIGYVITLTSSAGYGGDITFSMGIDQDGNMTRYSITSISETAGLGMKATEDDAKSDKDFCDQFKKLKNGNYSVVKHGSEKGENEIEAISGATITSRAMTTAVDAGFTYYNSELKGGK